MRCFNQIFFYRFESMEREKKFNKQKNETCKLSKKNPDVVEISCKLCKQLTPMISMAWCFDVGYKQKVCRR